MTSRLRWEDGGGGQLIDDLSHAHVRVRVPVVGLHRLGKLQNLPCSRHVVMRDKCLCQLTYSHHNTIPKEAVAA